MGHTRLERVYTGRVLRYAITDGLQYGADMARRRTGLLADALRWARDGVEFVQLREKDLHGGELVAMAESFATIFREHGGKTKLLVNGRADIAVAAGADGVHLTSRAGELTAAQVRQVFAASGVNEPVVCASCHSVADVERARDAGVSLILFGPVFEKRVRGEVVVEGVGLELLREACEVALPAKVLALGGITAESCSACMDAGAAGVAGIRLFAESSSKKPLAASPLGR